MPEPSVSELPLLPHQGRPKVIYVMGAGRSGSTILGVALGNCDSIFYAGELDAWLRRSGIPSIDGPERTQFWHIVHGAVDGAADLFGDRAWQCLEHSLAPFRVCGLARRQLRRRYRQITENLYRAITHTAGAAYIVDTSHYPLRARELQKVNNIDLYLVFLVRDPQSVVASFSRQDVGIPSRSPIATNAYLYLTYILSALVFLRQPRDQRLYLRYENFITDPHHTLRRILHGIDASTVLPELTALKTGIPFQGNRLLKSQIINLESDVTSPTQVSRVTAILQFPLLLVLSRLRPAVSTSNEHIKATGR